MLVLISKLESELALARSKYQPSSVMVTGLEAKINNLIPLLKKNQLEAIDSAINLTKNRISKNLSQLENVKNQFINKPKLIKEYNTIQQKLDIAQQNLIGLEKAREKFKLEITQNSFLGKLYHQNYGLIQ